MPLVPTPSNVTPIPESQRVVVSTQGRHVTVPLASDIDLLVSIETNGLPVTTAVYINSSGSCTAADNATINTAQVVGFVAGDGVIQQAGTLDGFSGLVAGRLYYLGTAGGIRSTPLPNNATGQCFVPVGIAKSETELLIKIERLIVL